MAEWLNAPDLKFGINILLSWVRIPLSPYMTTNNKVYLKNLTLLYCSLYDCIIYTLNI